MKVSVTSRFAGHVVALTVIGLVSTWVGIWLDNGFSVHGRAGFAIRLMCLLLGLWATMSRVLANEAKAKEAAKAKGQAEAE